ncbi:MAG: hypothetical protein A2Z29_09875 [Chloroflexi bacterium RBG_16_56_11]|nr:MAG: hypothetical protein A2Z29_09875 [Chloroflexi bacterium RBG_16_56_11]
MNETQKKILEMLAQNRINIDEACRLLSAVEKEKPAGSPPGEEPGPKTRAKYLRVTVTPGEGPTGNGNLFQDGNVGRVNIRIPVSLIHAGLKLTALIPPQTYEKINASLKEKGINYDIRNLKPVDIEEIIEALGDMQIDVESGRGERMKVFVE